MHSTWTWGVLFMNISTIKNNGDILCNQRSYVTTQVTFFNKLYEYDENHLKNMLTAKDFTK